MSDGLAEVFVLSGVLLAVGVLFGIIGSLVVLYLRRAGRRARHRRGK